MRSRSLLAPPELEAESMLRWLVSAVSASMRVWVRLWAEEAIEEPRTILGGCSRTLILVVD